MQYQTFFDHSLTFILGIFAYINFLFQAFLLGDPVDGMEFTKPIN